MPAASIEILETASISTATWDEIWNLTHRYYDTDRSYMRESLGARQRIALFRSPEDGSLVGMSSLDVYLASFRGQALAAIFTSHVLLREDYRGQNLVQRLGFRVFLQTRLRHPLRNIFWFFDTFSYKSYLLLARNLRHFWPRRERQTPAWERDLMNHLAGEIYGDAWEPAWGIVVRSGRKRLRPGTAPLDRAVAGDPDFEFFAGRNPGHAQGDMLVCLCPLTVSNWLGIAMRSVARKRGSASAGLEST
jgi:hypothetical protein